MKLALLADVHANLEALAACLDHARESGADAYAFLGDLVGYGADPAPVLERIERYAAAGAAVVAGNHDVAVVEGATDYMDSAAGETIGWTRRQLSPRQLEFLAGLPLVARLGGALLVHASAAAPDRWTYVTDPLSAAHTLAAADETYVFCGHVHQSVLYYTGAAGRPLPFSPAAGIAIPVSPHRRWLGVVGSVGQPRDGNTAACYAIMDLERARLTFFRVPYDWRAAAAKIRAARLPESLAERLGRGE